MDTFKKVNPGQPLKIHAATYNACIDAALDHRSRQVGNSASPRPEYLSSGIVLMQNDTGADLDRFEVVGIDGPVVDPATDLAAFQHAVVLSGVTPTADHASLFAVMAEPTPSGAIGRAWVSGVCPVQIDITDEEHQYAAAADGETEFLESASSGGATILWKEPAPDPPPEPLPESRQAWALVRFGATAKTKFLAVITGYRNYSNDPTELYRWEYNFRRVTKTGAGHAFAATGDATTDFKCYNHTEAPNTPTAAVWGNGVDRDVLWAEAPGMSVLPVPEGAVVEMEAIDDEYWFVFENAVGGTCTVGGS